MPYKAIDDGHPRQVITLDHDKYERELNNMPESHNKSIQARDNMKLQPVKTEGHPSDLKARLPKLYRALGEDPGTALQPFTSCLSSQSQWPCFVCIA